MSLVDTLRKDMFQAKRDSDENTSGILSLVITSIVNAKINKGEELSDEEQIEIIRKEVKKLQDAYTLYMAGGREDLAKKEKSQMDTLNKYLPQLMSEEEVRAYVNAVVVEKGITVTQSNQGQVMGMVMPQLKGKADGSTVGKVVRELIPQ